MTAVFCIIAVVALISLYDYVSSRSWQLVTSDIRNEVVFENRNKKYGAFQIRQDYNRNMVVIMTSLVFGTGVLFAAYAGLRSSPEMIIEIPQVDELNPEVEYVLDLKSPDPLPELPKNQVSSSEATTAYVDPVIVDRTIKKETLSQEELDKLKASNTSQTKTGEGIGTIEIKKEIKIEPPVIIKSTEPVAIPEVDAEYPGGFKAMAKYIQQNMVVPQVFSEVGTSGKVYLRFVVGADGEISSVRVMRGVSGCPECDKAAMKVVKSMPRWKPGKVSGENVSSYFDLPINFELE